jgi:uncharacterized membrane protein
MRGAWSLAGADDPAYARVEHMIEWLMLVCAIGCALVAGVLFIFSAGIMRALGTLPPAQGIRAMQAINVVILNPWFLGIFVGTAVLCVLSLVGTIAQNAWPPPVGPLVGSLLYLVGVVMVTRIFHIPRNDALAAAVPESEDAARLWRAYLVEWTWWNHVRTAAALAAAVAFLVL